MVRSRATVVRTSLVIWSTIRSAVIQYSTSLSSKKALRKSALLRTPKNGSTKCLLYSSERAHKWAPIVLSHCLKEAITCHLSTSTVSIRKRSFYRQEVVKASSASSVLYKDTKGTSTSWSNLSSEHASLATRTLRHWQTTRINWGFTLKSYKMVIITWMFWRFQ